MARHPDQFDPDLDFGPIIPDLCVIPHIFTLKVNLELNTPEKGTVSGLSPGFLNFVIIKNILDAAIGICFFSCRKSPEQLRGGGHLPL